MTLSLTADRLIQAQAHAEAQVLMVDLRLWRDGLRVQARDGYGRMIARLLTWAEIEAAQTNPINAVIDECVAEIENAKA